MKTDVELLGTSLKLQRGQLVDLSPATNLPLSAGIDWFASPADGKWSDGVVRNDDSIVPEIQAIGIAGCDVTICPSCEFTQQYIETALWSSMTTADVPLDENYSADDLSPEALESITKDCETFQQRAGEMIDDNVSGAGHDFWLTRNGHGAGFWDGD